MTGKHWTLIAFAIVLCGLSAYLNKDWFVRENIHIFHRSRPARDGGHGGRGLENSAVNPILFGFDHHEKLTSIKVIPLGELETNKYAHAIWHLVSESNSVPVKDFTYGQPIKGMHPTIKGAMADPLEPGVKYRLFVETKSLKGVHDFVPDPKNP